MEPRFFLPDGNGGSMDEEEAEEFYSSLRQEIANGSFWPAESFSHRRVYSLESNHVAGSFSNTVGVRNVEGWTPLAIFESLDELYRSRFVVRGLANESHIDAHKVRRVEYFTE